MASSESKSKYAASYCNRKTVIFKLEDDDEVKQLQRFFSHEYESCNDDFLMKLKNLSGYLGLTAMKKTKKKN